MHSYRGWHHHWRQCAWPFPSGGFRVSAGARVSVEALHDDLGIWYRASADCLHSCPSGGVGNPRSTKSGGSLERLVNPDASASSERSENVMTSASPERSENLRTSASSENSGRPEVAETLAVSARFGGLETALPDMAEGSTKFLSEAEPDRPHSASDTDVRTASSLGAGESGHVAADKWSCTCGMHEKQSPERIGQLGDAAWRRTVSQAVQNALAHLSPDVSPSQESDKDDRSSQKDTLRPSKTCSELTGAFGNGSFRSGKSEEASGQSVSDACQSTDAGKELGSAESAANRAQIQAKDCSDAPIVLVVDDSPLLSLLAARHLSKLSKPLRNAPELGTSRLPSSQTSMRAPGTVQNCTPSDSLMETGADSRTPDSLATTTESLTDLAAQLAVDKSKQPAQSALPQVRFLDQAGPVGVKGFVERRTAACGIATAFVPRRIEPREGDGGTINLEGKLVSVHF